MQADFSGEAPPRREMLAAKASDLLKARFDTLYKQANDHKFLSATYTSYARKLKLDNSKQLRIFTNLARNLSELLQARPSLAALRRFEKDVKERIKATRQIIGEAKESFDNQLKIHKLKDTIFAVNEQLTKAKKQGAFSSLIAAKSIPKSIHCLGMKLLEERIAHPEKYIEDTTSPELDDPKLYHYAIFSDNVIAA